MNASLLRTWGALTALTLAALVGCGSPQGADTVAAHTDGAIIGGDDVTGSEAFAKSVVSLVDTSQGALCTASIVSSTTLVTAAHCVDADPSDLVVIFNRNVADKQLVTRQVTSFKTSPVWAARQNQPLNNGDIAVVHFAGGLPAGFAPIKMLASAAGLTDGQTVTLAGYGNNDGAKKSGAGKLRYVDTTLKKAAYSKSEILVEQSKGVGACHGDSGGPAYIKNANSYVLIGVTSRGVDDPQDTCAVSAAYTSVAYYAAWIVRTAKALDAAAKNNAPASALAASF